MRPATWPQEGTDGTRGTLPSQATFDFFPFLFLTRPWRFLDRVPELLLFTDDLDCVFLLPDTFLRLPTKSTRRVYAPLRALSPLALPPGVPPQGRTLRPRTGAKTVPRRNRSWRHQHFRVEKRGGKARRRHRATRQAGF